MFEDQAAAMARGAGLPASLPGITPPEVEAAIAEAQYYLERRWHGRSTPKGDEEIAATAKGTQR